MAEEEGQRRYTFPPLERRGLLLGLGASQLAVVALVSLACLAVIRAIPTMAGLLVAATAVGAAGAAVLWRVAGRSPSEWAPVAGRWAWRRGTRRPTSHAPAQGAIGGRPAAVRPVPSLAGVEVMAAHLPLGGRPLGIVKDSRAGTYAAVVAVRGRSFSLLDQGDKQRRLSAWGAVLAGLAHEGSPVYRLQWIERSVPADRQALCRYLAERGAPVSAACRHSYEGLVSASGPVGEHHEVLLVVAVHRRRAGARPVGERPVRQRGEQPAVAVLRRELRLLQDQLQGADLLVDRVLDQAELVAAIRSAVDPPASGSARPAAGPGSSPWPVATDERWSVYRTDGAFHVTYWVEEWPRVEVGPDVLAPLLLGGRGRRAIALVMAPVAPARAAREAEAARTAHLADEELRRRAGFLATARRRRQADGVARRETELADGHGEYRFSGYVTVSAADHTELDTACAEVEQAARRAHLELRRLYGQQEEALSWTLPLGRGLS